MENKLTTKQASAQQKEPAYDQRIMRLAGLATDEYERIRKTEAQRLGMRTNALDADVKRKRKDALVKQAQDQSRADLGLDDALDEWTEPVDGAALLDEVYQTLRRFVIMSESCYVAVTLWIVFTHLIENEAVVTSPRLAIMSPEKQCGKTRLLEIIGEFVFRPILASNISPSVVFRALDICPMTMLVDEADSFVRDQHGNFNQELRGVLNSGHTRASAYVMRSVLGDDRNWVPKKFSTWGAFAVAAIGSLPDTWIDRSIVIALKRKLRDQLVRRFRKGDKRLAKQLAQTAQKIRRWVKDSLAAFASTKISPLKELSDRAADNWEMLIAIATVAGGQWLERARAAALELSGRIDNESRRTLLLSDVRVIFSANRYGNIFSRDLCRKLAAIEGRPWAEYRRGVAISQNQLAGLLRGFQIYPTSVRVKVKDQEDKVGSGYKPKDFADAFKRYLPPASAEDAEAADALTSGLSLNGDDPQKTERATSKGKRAPQNSRDDSPPKATRLDPMTERRAIKNTAGSTQEANKR